MEALLLVYATYAVLVLIWCSSVADTPKVEYVGISKAFLDAWMELGGQPIVFDLCSQVSSKMRLPSYAAPLVLSYPEFSQMVRWIPPGTALVFCVDSDFRNFDRDIEFALLGAGICTVYWLTKQAAFQFGSGALHNGHV